MSKKENIAIILALFASSMLMSIRSNTSIYLIIILLLVVLTAIVMIIAHKNNTGPLKEKTFSSKLNFEVKYTDETGELMTAGETPGKISIPCCESRRFLIKNLNEYTLNIPESLLSSENDTDIYDSFSNNIQNEETPISKINNNCIYFVVDTLDNSSSQKVIAKLIFDISNKVFNPVGDVTLISPFNF